MNIHFNSYRILKKIEPIALESNKVKAWNSFSQAPTVGENVSDVVCVYGEMNPKMDAMQLDL